MSDQSDQTDLMPVTPPPPEALRNTPPPTGIPTNYGPPPNAGPLGSAPKPPGTGASSSNAAKDTASAALGEMKSALKGASRREPYPWLAIAAAAFTVVWLLYPEDDNIGAENLKLWTVFVLVSAALVFAPMLRGVVKVTVERAWQLCAGGAAGLVFAWVAFLLPAINTNQAFFGTLGVAAAALAAWTAPGRAAP
jgi:hypothetical protein